MKELRINIAQGLSQTATFDALMRPELELLAAVPEGEIIDKTRRRFAGALSLNLASGVRIVHHYRIEFDDHVTFASLYLEEKDA